VLQRGANPATAQVRSCHGSAVALEQTRPLPNHHGVLTWPLGIPGMHNRWECPALSGSSPQRLLVTYLHQAHWNTHMCHVTDVAPVPRF